MRVLLVILAFSLNASILVSQEEKSFSYKDDKELFERVVKVEEALVYLKETIAKGFEQRDKRFEDLAEQRDKRFEDLAEQSDKRFEDLKWYMGHRFNTIYWILGILSGILVAIFGCIFRKMDHHTKEIQKISSKLDYNTKEIHYNTKEIQVINYKLDILLQSIGKQTFENCYDVAKKKGDSLTKEDLITHDKELEGKSKKTLATKVSGIKEIFREGNDKEALAMAKSRKEG